MTANDKRWQAEDDARILSEAVVISKDPARIKAATEAAARIAEEKRKEASAMAGVARRKGNISSSSQTNPNIRTKSDDLKKSAEKKTVKEIKNKFNVFQKI